MGQELDSKPRLVFVHSPRSGACRRVEAYLASVLQRRRNHETFRLVRLDETARPDLAQRLGVAGAPALVVVEGQGVRARLDGPRSSLEIERFLAPWLA